MAREYIELDLISDPDEFARLAREWLEMAIPGYQWEDPHVETFLAEAFAFMGAEIVDQVAQVPPILFAYLGRWLLGVEPISETAATGTATITFDASGATPGIPAGWQLLVSRADGTSTLVVTEADVLAPSGAGSKAVPVSSLIAGADDNDAGGVAQAVEPLDGVTGVTITPLAGGTDQEDDDAYLDRLAARMALLSPRPILPTDYAAYAAQVPGVGRAVALDLYQPATGEGGVGTPRTASAQTNVPGAITVSITGPAGGAPTAGLMQNVYDALNDDRVLNTVPYVIPPSYHDIGVQLTVVAFPGADRAAVKAGVEASLATWLDSLTWGAQGSGQGVDWANVRTVRISEAIDWANRPQGVNYVEQSTVRLKLGAGSFAATDITMAGPVPLPRLNPAALNVTVLLASEATP